MIHDIAISDTLTLVENSPLVDRVINLKTIKSPLVSKRLLRVHRKGYEEQLIELPLNAIQVTIAIIPQNTEVFVEDYIHDVLILQNGYSF